MRKVKNKNKKINLIFLISLVFLCTIVTYSFSKYIIQISQIHIQEANNFYFKSNILDKEDKQYILNDWDGISKYTINANLCNYEDLLRINDEDIKYRVEAISKTAGISVNIKTGSQGKLTGKVKSENKIQIEITSSRQFAKEEYAEVEIIVTSTKPYEKVLKGAFKINVENIENYKTELKDEGEYVYLYITTYDFDKNLKISYDNTKLVLDTGNEILRKYNNFR